MARTYILLRYVRAVDSYFHPGLVHLHLTASRGLFGRLELVHLHLTPPRGLFGRRATGVLTDLEILF